VIRLFINMEPGADDADYRESSDISLVHGEMRKERQNVLEAGMVPVPLWLIGLSLLVVFGGGIYLGLFSGGFSEAIFNEREGLSATDVEAPVAGTASGAAPAESLADIGKRVFAQDCTQCHQATALGQPGVYPPLSKSEWVNGPSKRVMMIVLKGLQGPVTVTGKPFNNSMPAWGAQLTDKKIAAVLTYVRSQFGNSAPPISPEEVAAIRKEFTARTEPWSEAELLAVPADAKH